MLTGKVDKIVNEKGFGFIRENGRKKRIFFHVSGLQNRYDFDRLREGDTVEFETEDSEKGPRATNIRIVAVA